LQKSIFIDTFHFFIEKLEAAKIHYPERTVFVNGIPLTAAGRADKKILEKDIE